MTGSGPRPGIALIAALSLLALLGLLIAGAVASTAVAQRSTRLAITDGVTSTAADYALATVLGDPASFPLADAPLGRAVTWTVPARGAAATVSGTRLPNGVVWLVADAAVSGVDQGHRRIGLIARYPGMGPLPASGLIVRGGASVSDVQFSADSTGDPDCARAPTAPWIQSSDSATHYLTARQAAALDSAPGVRHVRGDTTITSGTFSGIVVIDGALRVTGNWSGSGLILVRGPVQVTGTVAITGALLSFADGASAEIGGGSIRYAPCVVAREIRAAIRLERAPGRAWAELF
jgi:hypothetical protein